MSDTTPVIEQERPLDVEAAAEPEAQDDGLADAPGYTQAHLDQLWEQYLDDLREGIRFALLEADHWYRMGEQWDEMMPCTAEVGDWRTKSWPKKTTVVELDDLNKLSELAKAAAAQAFVMAARAKRAARRYASVIEEMEGLTDYDLYDVQQVKRRLAGLSTDQD